MRCNARKAETVKAQSGAACAMCDRTLALMVTASEAGILERCETALHVAEVYDFSWLLREHLVVGF